MNDEVINVYFKLLASWRKLAPEVDPCFANIAVVSAIQSEATGVELSQMGFDTLVVYPREDPTSSLGM